MVAVTATSAEPLPTLTQDLVSRLHALGLGSKQVGGATVAAVVGADRQQLPPEPQEVDLTPMRVTQVERIPDKREAKVTEAVASFEALLGEQTSDASGLDLLALLEQAGSLDVADIVVVSSGVSTVDPLDFRELGWNRSVKSVVDDLDEDGLLPRDLHGKDVTFVGLGGTAGDQPRLAGPEQDWVEQLWLSVCRRAGAECRLASEAPPASAPVADQPVPVVPVVSYDTPTGAEERPDGPCRTLRRLPSELLFDGDSADLRPEADSVLREVVREVAAGATITEVAGHTADVDGGDGQDLSRRRAAAVVQRLLNLGVDPGRVGTVVGRGEAREIEPSRNPDGTVNEALAAKNRRVEITTTTIQCESNENGETDD